MRVLHARPDMDNLFVANNHSISGLSDAQRVTMAMHWLGAGANLLEGGDMTQIDSLGTELLFGAKYRSVSNAFGNYPMRPRNPISLPSCGGAVTPGGT